MKKLSVVSLFLLALIGAYAQQPQQKKSFSVYAVGFYNQENLFDCTHDEGDMYNPWYNILVKKNTAPCAVRATISSRPKDSTRAAPSAPPPEECGSTATATTCPLWFIW